MSSLQRIYVETSPSSIGSSISSLRRLSLDDIPKPNSVQTVDDNVHNKLGQRIGVTGPSFNALTIRRACRYDCYCKCHVQSSTSSIRSSLKFGSSKSQCTEPDCEMATSVEERAGISATFFRNIIARVISSKAIKVRYDLNHYRMVSEGSDALRYVKHGNLEKLKMCITTGEATIWDTAPDGWSLLHVS